MAQWLMATLNPPGLACIAPYDGLVDQYRCSNYHGGIFCNYRSSWYTNLRADNQHRPAGKTGRAPMRLDLVGAITEHTLDDDWWRERSPFWRLEDIRVPVLSIGHWGKMGLHLRGNILGYEEMRAPKKLVVTGAKNVHEAHHQYDQVEFHQKELLPFYDLHLKGKTTASWMGRRCEYSCAATKVARGGGMAVAAREIRAVLSARGAVRQRDLAQRRRLVFRAAARRRECDELHLSRLEMDQRRGDDRDRTGGPIRCGACSRLLRCRSLTISKSPARSC